MASFAEGYEAVRLRGLLARLEPTHEVMRERWQTLRTIGASRSLVRRVALVEAAGTAILGAALGVGAFFALRPLLALLPVAGERLVAGDVTVSGTVVLVVGVAVVIGAVLAAARSARRAESSAWCNAVLSRTRSRRPWASRS